MANGWLLFRRLLGLAWSRRGGGAGGEGGDFYFASRACSGFGLDALAVDAFGLGQVRLGVVGALGSQARRLGALGTAGENDGAGWVLLHLQGDVIQNRLGAVINVSAVGLELKRRELLRCGRGRRRSFNVDVGHGGGAELAI